MFIKNFSLYVLSITVLVSCNNTSNTSLQNTANSTEDNNTDCSYEIRGGFDIGSGSTKLKIANVKICKNGLSTVDTVYFSKNKAVEYGKDVKDLSHPGTFSDKIISEGVNAVHSLIAEANLKFIREKTCGNDVCKVKAWRGIMTQAFRESKNWNHAKNTLEKAVDGLIIKRLTQDEEALFGFYPITLINGFDKTKAVVWDMGGSSTQITSFNADFDPKKFSAISGVNIIKTPIGSSLAKKVLNDNNLTDINPIINTTRGSIIIDSYFTEINNKLAPEFAKYLGNFKELFVNDKKYYVIGGILAKSLPGVIKDFQVSKAHNLENIALASRIKKSEIEEQFNKIKFLDSTELNNFSKINFGTPDEKLPFSKDYASNSLIALTYMNTALNIKEIYPIEIDGTDTIVINPEFENNDFWHKDSN